MAASTSEDGSDDPVRLTLCRSAYSHFFHLKKK
ncbi:MAG: hypothetical protein QOD25_4459 [Alphaproteobacteria bacterium]|jgi:hypothetical protein|nr:hypothetical protein [Alphaproteobacteria bacterium]